jgi:hypothetical protein
LSASNPRATTRFIGGRDQLPVPSQVGLVKVGGIDLNKPRMRWVAQALLALAAAPHGFTTSDLACQACQVQRLSRQSASAYGPRRAAYDLKKLGGKQLLRRIDQTRRYEPVSAGLKALTALRVLRDKVVKPLLAAAEQTAPSRGAQNPTALDRHYDALRVGMNAVFHELGIAA